MEFAIDFISDVPSYVQLADQLRAAITDGRLAAHEPIPSLEQLRQESGLSKGTIVKAVDLLAREGLVRRVRGRGTYVTER